MMDLQARSHKFILIGLFFLGGVVYSSPSSNWSEWQPGQNLFVVAPDPNPFWKSKEKVYKKIREDRAVIVSVKEQKLAKGFNLYMRGAGHVKAPLEFTWKELLQFDNLPQVSSFIKEVKYTPEKGKLYVLGEAFGYKAGLWMLIDSEQSGLLKARVIEGVFKGLTASIHATEFSKKVTEISLTAQYDYEKLQIPALFVEFGLEVVLQKMAERFRAFIEEQHRKVPAVGVSKSE